MVFIISYFGTFFLYRRKIKFIFETMFASPNRQGKEMSVRVCQQKRFHLDFFLIFFPFFILLVLVSYGTVPYSLVSTANTICLGCHCRVLIVLTIHRTLLIYPYSFTFVLIIQNGRIIFVVTGSHTHIYIYLYIDTYKWMFLLSVCI